MKKFWFVMMIFVLAACSAAPAAQPAAEPAAQQPIVVAITVVAPEAPAAVAPATEVPAAAPVATEAPAAAPTTEPAVVENAPTATLPPAVGGDLLVNITRDGDQFSLKCSPSQINFSATSVSAYIVDVVIYYRMVDKLNGMSSQWYAGPTMESDGKSTFTRSFSALDVNPDVRFDNGWFEYQFIATTKTGDVVWRSNKETYQKQVTFTKECP